VLRDALIFLSQSTSARRFVRSAPGAQTMARRFVAGETVTEGINACRELNRLGMTTTLDFLGESVSNRAEAVHSADVYVELIERLHAEGINGNVSLKLTAMGQDIDEGFMREQVGRVIDRAREYDMFVRFDMEGSTHTEKTLRFFWHLWGEGYRNIGPVIQSYLRRSKGDIEKLNAEKVRVRLCKGAYKEPESVAYQDKRDVDKNYIDLMQMLLEHGNYPGIATHDEAMIRATRDFAKQKGIEPSRYEFQMLYGVRRDFQQMLVAEKYGMRIYVPFGDAWYPYLMRRLAERPANLFFIMNAVARESPFRHIMPK
jgi:proline dehydrogenase